MRPDIDYPNSVKSKRLKIKVGLVRKLADTVVYILTVLVIPYFSWIYISRLISANIYYHHWLKIYFLIFLSLIWIVSWIVWLLNVDRFKAIKGINKTKNRQIVTETLIDWKWNLFDNNKDFIVSFPNEGINAAERQVNILFDNNEILINVITFSFRNLKTPFFWFQDGKIKRKLTLKIMEKIEMHAP